jgi:hypothetical protein
MSVKTREELKQEFSDQQTATGAKFADLIDSLKAVQEAVSDPSASGKSITFIATFAQDTDGKVTVTKKTVNFSGYQTTEDMQNYQINDVQRVGDVTVSAGYTQAISHKMKHYPTVRLLDLATGLEVLPSEYMVKHADVNNVDIILGSSLISSYKYILD